MATLTFLKHLRTTTPSGSLTSLLSLPDTPFSSSSDDSSSVFSDVDDGPFFDLHFLNLSGSGDPSPPSKPFSLLKSAAKFAVKLGGVASEEKASSKKVVLRCLSKIRPLYVKVARRGAAKKVEKEGSPAPTAVAPKRVACRHLRKSRSASAAATVGRRRDELLLKEEEEDGIEGAIAHCKRSFNGSRDALELPLARSRSDPCEERRSVDVIRRCRDEDSC